MPHQHRKFHIVDAGHLYQFGDAPHVRAGRMNLHCFFNALQRADRGNDLRLGITTREGPGVKAMGRAQRARVERQKNY